MNENPEIQNKIWEGRPHILGFAGYYLLILYEISLLIFLFPMLFNENTPDRFQTLNYNGLSSILIWILATLIPLLILTFVRIEARWFGISFLYIFCGLLFYKLDIGNPIFINHILFTIPGFVLLEVYRRGFRYYITKNSLVMIYKGIKKWRRDVFIDKVSDIVIEQSIFSKIFNIGNVIPISNSGFGLGNSSIIGATGLSLSPIKKIGGTAVLGKISGRSDPRVKNEFMFYKVKDPEEALQLILKLNQ